MIRISHFDMDKLEEYGFVKCNGEPNSYKRILDETDPIKKQCFLFVTTDWSYISLGFSCGVLYICTPLGFKPVDESTDYLIANLPFKEWSK